MDGKEKGRKTRTSSKCSEGLERWNSGLHSGHPTFPYLLRLSVCFPSPVHRPPGRTAATFPRPGTRAAGSEAPGGERAARRRPAKGGAGRGRRGGQSAGEAVGGPRLVGPAASNLLGLPWSFEPLHPLAAHSLLKPPGPKRWPGRAGVRRKKPQVPPSAHPAQYVRRESKRSPTGFPTDGTKNLM